MQPQVSVLGPFAVTADGRSVALGGPRPRRLLALLALRAGEAVSTDVLVEAVWEDAVPSGAAATLRTHVANLRRRLRAAGIGDVLVTRAPGYRLAVAPEQLDAHRFEQLAADGRAALDAGDARRASALLQQALGLWRGRVLEDLGTPRFVEAEAARLDELRLAALDARIDADLALGRHDELVGELEALVDAHPFREQLWAQLMLALYRAGRQADALAAYRAAGRRLDEELGLAPGPALAELEAAILRQDPALLGSRGPPLPAPAGQGPPSHALFDVVRRVAMVGRQAELERLTALWSAVRDGGRRVALVAGEAGVGKTRLVAELAAIAGDEGAALLVGHCDHAALVAYQPVAEALHGSTLAGDAFAQAPEPLVRRLAPLLQRAARPQQPADQPPTEDAGAQRAALLDAVCGLFTRMSKAAPVVLVVEDGEAIDPASARLLRHLARYLPERMLLVVCFRDPPGGEHPPLLELLADLEGRGVADRLTLTPLPEDDLAALVAAWTRSPAPAELVRRLWSFTGGNPFYASEVIADLVTDGDLADDRDTWRVPAGVRDVLRARLRALSPDTQQIIACAAVLGREVDTRLLTRVANEPMERVGDALAEAGRAGWLVETGRAWSASYAFRHALVQEAVYADIPTGQRQGLHLRAADALEAVGRGRPADLAGAAAHLRAAGTLAEPGRAADASLHAADAAAHLFAWDEAVAHAEAAVALLADADASPERQHEAAVRTAELLIRSTIDYGRAIEHLEAAGEHARAAGDATAAATLHARLGYVRSLHHSVMDIPRALAHFAAAEPVLTDGEPAFHVHYGKGLAAGFALRIEEGAAALQRAVELAEGLDRPDLVAFAQPTQAMFLASRGELAAAYALTEQAWATAQEHGDPHLGWEAVTVGAVLGNVCLLDPGSAEAWCRRGLAQPRFDTLARPQEGISDQLAYALAIMGRLATARDTASRLPDDAICQRLLLLLDGAWEAAEQSWAAALAHDLDNGDRMNAALNACWLGQARRLLGRDADAVAALEQALALVLDGRQVPTELMARAELARVLAAGGAVDDAEAHLARCDAIVNAEEDWRGQAGAVDLARAGLAAARGQTAADDAYARAVAVFTSYRLPWRRCDAMLAWAGWLAATGRHDDAEAKRAAVQREYAELDAPPRWHAAPATTARRPDGQP